MFIRTEMPKIEKVDKKLVGMSKLRTACWFKYVYSQSGQKSLAKLGVWFEARGVFTYWNHYSSSGASPSPELLIAVDKVMQHASDWYLEGPERLPLWHILEGDGVKAKLMLTRLLSGFDMYAPKRTLSEKWKALFDLILRERVGSRWANHKDLPDLTKQPDNYLKEVLSDDQVVLDQKFFVAIIAMATQTIESQHKLPFDINEDDMLAWSISNYFMKAVEDQPLANAFGNDVSDYISHWYKNRMFKLPVS